MCMLLCYEICFYIVRHQCKAVQFGSKNSGWDYYTRSRFRYKGLISIIIYIYYSIYRLNTWEIIPGGLSTISWTWFDSKNPGSLEIPDAPSTDHSPTSQRSTPGQSQSCCDTSPRDPEWCTDDQKQIRESVCNESNVLAIR